MRGLSTSKFGTAGLGSCSAACLAALAFNPPSLLDFLSFCLILLDAVGSSSAENVLRSS